jgi:hypothetical protein
MATAWSKLARSNLAALFCCLLTLLAALDPLPYLQQIVLGPPATAPGFPTTPDDDDEMLDLGCETTAAPASRREPRPPSPAPVLAVSRPGPLSSPTQRLTAPSVGEHTRRNGLGGPLLC